MPARPTPSSGRIIDSPVGPLLLQASADGLTRCLFVEASGADVEAPPAPVDRAEIAVLDQAEAELGEYFAGDRTGFDVPLELRGTPFQLDVWAQLRAIPHGATASYGDLARNLGNPQASRAVGMANNKNPVAIIVPCHRVVGADGSLTGYAGGLDRKRLLLDLEAGIGALL